MIDNNTEVELVATKGEKCFKKVMKYGEALQKKRVKGWVYRIYQVGFCSIKENV